jgi:large subunit ribosomal protein L29
MKPKEVRDMSDEQIQQELKALERKVFDLRTQAETEELHQPSQLSNARHNIARLRTVLRQRELAAQAKTAPAGKEAATS